MNPERWERIVQLHQAALELKDHERDPFLGEQCGGDQELRDLLRKMLGEVPTGFIQPPAMPALPLPPGLEGEFLADFEIHGELGRGGMGTVYLARQISLQREVALKVVRMGPGVAEEDLERFEREAQRIATLDHNHIVPVHVAGREGDVAYFAMPHLRGGSLADLLSQARDGKDLFDQADCLGWIQSIAEALEYVHQKGMQHRDVKPGNVLLDEHGRAFLADFGIARRPDTDTLTQERGTPAYMSPEQATGDGMDFRSDVYSLGVVLYELLTLSRPFADKTGLALRNAIGHAEPEALRTVAPGVSRDLETICHTAMAKRLSARYPSAGAMALDLELLQQGRHIMARPPSTLERGWDWVVQHKTGAIAAAAMLVTAVGAMLVTKSHSRRVSIERTENAALSALDASTIAWEGNEHDAAADALDEALREYRALSEVAGEDHPSVRMLTERLQVVAGGFFAENEEELNQTMLLSQRDPLGVPHNRVLALGFRLARSHRVLQAVEDVADLSVAHMVGTTITLRSVPENARVIALRLDPLTHRPEDGATPLDLGTTPLDAITIDSGTYHFYFSTGTDLQGELVRSVFGAKKHIEPPVVYLRSSQEDGMANIPGGLFEVHPQEQERVQEAMSLVIPTFLADRTEVSNASYWQFCQETGYPIPRLWPEAGLTASSNWGDRPVVWVDWNSAEAYCAWAGKRLPTFYEWSRMARGTDNLETPWGAAHTESNIIEAAANVDYREGSRVGLLSQTQLSPDVPAENAAAGFEQYFMNTLPVTHENGDRSLEGLLHLYGNVCEWTLGSGLNFEGGIPIPTYGEAYYRGRSWNMKPGFLEQSYAAPMAATGNHMGFRGVKGPPPASVEFVQR